MIAFWISAALLLVLALALVLPALLKSKNSNGKTAGDAAQANLSVLRSQLTHLDADFAAGSINADQLALAKSEIERRTLEEESTPEAAISNDLPAKSTRTAWALGLTIPLLAFGVYGFLGNISALDPANLVAKAETEPNPPEIEALVSAFAARLEAVPAQETPDPKAWEMLARSYAAMKKFPEANKAYQRAVELNPGNAQILADHAEVLAMLQGQSMVGEPTRLLARALVLDPNNLKALYLAGIHAFNTKDYPNSIKTWEKLISVAPPGNMFAQEIEPAIAEARNLASTTQATKQPASSFKAPGSATAGAGVVSGTVSLSAALAKEANPDDTVFIFARAEQGSRMPLAILRKQVRDLPLTFKFDDSMAMSPASALSTTSKVIIGARISKSGNAVPQAGDLSGQSAPVNVGASGVLIEIRELVKP